MTKKAGRIKRLRKHLKDRPKTRKAIGVILIVLGVLALITPLTPGSWLALIGMEFLEIRSAFLEKLKERFSKK
jgi:uncharacterized membrane protein HdeD (DUF308 family)